MFSKLYGFIGLAKDLNPFSLLKYISLLSKLGSLAISTGHTTLFIASSVSQNPSKSLGNIMYL